MLHIADWCVCIMVAYFTEISPFLWKFCSCNNIFLFKTHFCSPLRRLYTVRKTFRTCQQISFLLLSNSAYAHKNCQGWWKAFISFIFRYFDDVRAVVHRSLDIATKSLVFSLLDKLQNFLKENLPSRMTLFHSLGHQKTLNLCKIICCKLVTRKLSGKHL